MPVGPLLKRHFSMDNPSSADDLKAIYGHLYPVQSLRLAEDLLKSLPSIRFENPHHSQIKITNITSEVHQSLSSKVKKCAFLFSEVHLTPLNGDGSASLFALLGDEVASISATDLLEFAKTQKDPVTLLVNHYYHWPEDSTPIVNFLGQPENIIVKNVLETLAAIIRKKICNAVTRSGALTVIESGKKFPDIAKTAEEILSDPFLNTTYEVRSIDKFDAHWNIPGESLRDSEDEEDAILALSSSLNTSTEYEEFVDSLNTSTTDDSYMDFDVIPDFWDQELSIN